MKPTPIERREMTAEQVQIEALRKELLFWRRCANEERKAKRELEKEVIRLEWEIEDFTEEYGVEDREGDIIWFCSPEDKAKTLEKQRDEAREYSMTDTWFDLVSRKVGPPRREI
jgi:hypothetical protein